MDHVKQRDKKKKRGPPRPRGSRGKSRPRGTKDTPLAGPGEGTVAPLKEVVGLVLGDRRVA